MNRVTHPLLLTRRRVVDEGRRTVSACRRSTVTA